MLKILLLASLSALVISACNSLSQANPANPSTNLLPIGDGKISSSGKRGYVYSCQTQFGGGGAFRDGEWIQGAFWDPSKKIAVSGAVAWPNAKTTISLSGTQRLISGNNLPSHTTGIYPIQSTDAAYQYDRNPNSIFAQNIQYSLPSNPTLASSASCLPMGAIGISLTGAAIFNALDGLGKDAVAHELQDTCGGHPERSGVYHYHGPSICMKDNAGKSAQHSDLVGYVLDGFGLYGLYDESGKLLTNADLDECHGHTHSINWDGQQANMYHYHLTQEYPYSVGCFRGTAIRAQRQ